MGRIMTPITIGNILDPAREIRCDALVDTDAYCLTLPAAWRDRLGALPLSRSVALETADHRIVAGEIVGPVEIRIAGFDPCAGEVLFMEMEPGARGWEPLIGYVTLEQAGLVVDLVGHRLVRVPHLDLKQASRAA